MREESEMDRLDDDTVLEAVVATRDLDKKCINCIVWTMLVVRFVLCGNGGG